MKIIELLNKIANGEEVPKKIEYNDKIFIYDGFSYIYENKTFNEYNKLEEFISYGSDLNNEIEIIEEEKKIPEKLDVLIDIKSKDKIEALTNEVSEIQRRFNQLIDYLKSKGDE